MMMMIMMIVIKKLIKQKDLSLSLSLSLSIYIYIYIYIYTLFLCALSRVSFFFFLMKPTIYRVMIAYSEPTEVASGVIVKLTVPVYSHISNIVC